MRVLRSLGIAALLLALWVTTACCPSNADAAGKPNITVFAAGDTAHIFVHWAAVNKATGYTYTVAVIASNGTWSLPAATSTAATAVTALPTSTTADTAVFQVCVTSTGLGSPSTPGCSSAVQTTSNTWRRKLTPPVVNVDSTIGLLIMPKSVTVATLGTQTFCAFNELPSATTPGQTVWAEHSADAAACGSYYTSRFTTAQRTITAAQQAAVDTTCVNWTATGGTITGPACTKTGSLRIRNVAPNLYIASNGTVYRDIGK